MAGLQGSEGAQRNGGALPLDLVQGLDASLGRRRRGEGEVELKPDFRRAQGNPRPKRRMERGRNEVKP